MYIVFFRRGRGSRELCQGAAWGGGEGRGCFLQAGGGMGRGNRGRGDGRVVWDTIQFWAVSKSV